ncbi:Zinc finger CCCH domain-containing protein 62 [Morus notabilis]|uniref:Zinc finger CCCH domain-containing protein 62 n=1 Tax=Morus notabilis TaxID=981085 RepID=W9SDQ1_9ROSA|nr:zinc finger CCCH domain-containing protein 62 [Morus notabilis]EXC01341.1 Zinc finger CCCH domain-containing protein 62 [Morus notabilis]
MEIGKEEEDLYGTAESGSEYSSDDSGNDPIYSILEETHSKLSKLSIKNKKAKASIVEAIDLADEAESDGRDLVLPELDEIDEKSFEQVQRIIRAGQIEKLKVDQCKVYLRKNGLRLTGNKGTLIQRIKEHLEILNGGGEKMYPVSSFELNCKGDACTGDVVLFEQNVYDMFNIASRSANGGPCGTRIVAGRIVKESYGAAKQQHTFTVEVLWSKGEKPLPPLHPLLIKGRNLYRLKTLRQRWVDEGDRQKILTEKHLRGSLARSGREERIQEKEKRKLLKASRISRKEVDINQSHSDSTSVPKPFLRPQTFGISVNSVNKEKPAIGPQQLGISQPGLAATSTRMATQHQAEAKNSGLCVDYEKVTAKWGLEKTTIQDKYINQVSQNLVRYSSSSCND